MEDGDPAVSTLDGTLRQFSASSDGMKLWLAMGPELAAHQRAKGRQLEPAQDAVDTAAIASGQTQRRTSATGCAYRARSFWEEATRATKSASLAMSRLVGMRTGNILGAYSTAVDLAPAIAFWRSNTLHQALAGLGRRSSSSASPSLPAACHDARPLRNLTAATRRLAAGKLDVAVGHTQREDDLGTLARSLEVFRTGLLEKQRSEEKIALYARHDLLTGLPNRANSMTSISIAP